MSLGVIRPVRRGSIPHDTKLGVRDFAYWVLTKVEDAKWLHGSDVQVNLFLGANLHYDNSPDDPVDGLTRAMWRRNQQRMRRGKPMLISLHLTPQVLCNPLELARTIVHEAQHAIDIHTWTISHLYAREQEVSVPSIAWLETKADLAELKFVQAVTRPEVVAAYQRIVWGADRRQGSLLRLCDRYAGEFQG